MHAGVGGSGGSSGARRNRWGRGCFAAVLAVTLSGGALAGCSPRSVGLIGVARDASGNLMVVTDGCGEVLDYVSFTVTQGGGPTATAANGRLEYDRSNLGRFQLSGGPRATPVGKVSDLAADASYSVGAWNDGQSVSAGPMSFRRYEIADLPVDRVYTGSRSQQPPRAMSVAQWLAATCADKR